MHAVVPPAWSVIPFAAYLLAIAVLPLFAQRFWESQRNKLVVAVVASAPVLVYLLAIETHHGTHWLLHSAKEFAAFIALLGALFVISGGVYLRGSLAGTPIVNTGVLALGALLASLVGTTGASVLLIRPLLRANAARERKVHIVVFFIFIVSNAGGMLTPLGDPPLFLGFLRGVPFLWTLRLFGPWLLVNAALLLVFHAIDQIALAREERERSGSQLEEVQKVAEPLRIEGARNFLWLAGVLAVILASGSLGRSGSGPSQELRLALQIGGMLILAALSLATTRRETRVANGFAWSPIVEVAIVFAGIFVTMIPALRLLEARGAELGVSSGWQFFWATGILSSFLDNAPTYLTFASLAVGVVNEANPGAGLDVDALGGLLAYPDGALYLTAISCGAVLMGANTYIGNGPNFMVKSIAEKAGVRMPGFLGYMAWSGLFLLPLFVVVTLVFFRAGPGMAAPPRAAGADAGSDWPTYGGDAGGLRYSPLAAIDRGNVRELERAWSIRTGDLAADPPPPDHMAFQATPIVAGGLLLLPTPLGRVLALDPATGAQRWRFDATVVGREYPEYTSRGVASWVDPSRTPGSPCARRVFAATVDSRLFALDLATGARCADFGRDGQVDLREGVGVLLPRDYATSSPPVVAGDLVIVGSAVADNQRVDAPRGVVRAWDARSGALRWSWDPIPRGPDDEAYAGWDAEAARRTGAANAWAPLSVDAERDLVFVPTSSPSPDYFGGERPGDDRHANSVVALRASTGKLVWSFQVVHHDLWDYDVPAQPTLASVRRGGEEIPVVVQATKPGHLFVLRRDTGEPVFPVEERAVPASDVPGESAWPTQPFPVVPAPFVPQRLRPEDAWGLTPWDRGRCRERIAKLRNEGPFTPPSLRGTLVYPAHTGGANWGGVAIDPERRILVVNATNLAFEVRLIPRSDFESERAGGAALLREFAPQAGTPYGMRREPVLSPIKLPCNPPPWGTLTALSLDSGEVLWRRPLGTLPDLVPLPIPIELGLPNLGGPIATAGGLVFIAAAMDGILRAFDIETGEELWSERLPAGGNATPMTYLGPDGRQYVAIAAGGHGKLGTRRGDHVVAWALPLR